MAGFAYPTPIPARPRRAEQVPLVLANGCDPGAGCGVGFNRVLMRACTVTSPALSPDLSPGGREETFISPRPLGEGPGGAGTGPLLRVPARPPKGKVKNVLR